MTTILAYGDSLTWGSDPAVAGRRHPVSHRWPDVLASGLGQGVTMISDGVRGRCTAYDEHLADCDRNGARILPTVLYAHA
ncbi:MAG: arylesterase, partial [Ahrensia sp.]